MNKKKAARIAGKAKIITRKLAVKRQKAYYEPFFIAKKIWADKAVEYTADFALTVDRRIKAYRNKCIKLISGRDLFENADVVKQGNVCKKYKTEQYLDSRYDRVVVPDIRDTLVEMEKGFEQELAQSYEDYIINGSLRDSAELVYRDLGMAFNFNKFSEKISKYINNKKINWAKEVAKNIENAIKEELVNGYEKGLGSYDIAENIRISSGFSYSRSESIARTEVMSSCNYANYQASSDSPNVIGFTWSATGDGRTRQTHVKADGQKRKKGVPFDVGGHKLMFPLDGSLGAPAREIINCRCVLLDIFEGEPLNSNTVYDEKDAGTRGWLLRQSKEFQNDFVGGNAKRRMLEKGNLSKNEYSLSLEEIISRRKQSAWKNIATEFADENHTFVENITNNASDIVERGIRNNKEYAIISDGVTGCKVEGTKMYPGEAYSTLIPVKDLKNYVDIRDDNSVILMHNHPNSTTFSPGDIEVFFKSKKIKSMLVIGHDGEIFRLEKKDFLVKNYTEKQLDEAVESLCERMDSVYRVYKNTDRLLLEYHAAMSSFSRLRGLYYEGSAFNGKNI